MAPSVCLSQARQNWWVQRSKAIAVMGSFVVLRRDGSEEQSTVRRCPRVGASEPSGWELKTPGLEREEEREREDVRVGMQ